MMAAPLTFSIVTSSFNHARFIERTIRSVREQSHARVQHIVVDNLSTDGTAEILARWPHLTVIREPDGGQADAINKGFRLATGDIFGFLNSDDTLEPAALADVAARFQSNPAIQVVMGRCRFIDEQDRFIGIEHPSAFESHERVLEIWKGHCLPQPAIFWRREAWRAAGELDPAAGPMLDYDFFCRLSRLFPFSWMDRVLAGYRLHSSSITASMTDSARLEKAIAISRRYWGSPQDPLHRRLQRSEAHYRRARRSGAAARLARGFTALAQRRVGNGLAQIVAGILTGPDVALDLCIANGAPVQIGRAWQRARGRGAHRDPRTAAWRDFAAPHADGWVGPMLVQRLSAPSGAACLHVRLEYAPGRMAEPLVLEAFVDGVSVGKRCVGQGRIEAISWQLAAVTSSHREVRMAANTSWVPHDFFENGDCRPLSYKLLEMSLLDKCP